MLRDNHQKKQNQRISVNLQLKKMNSKNIKAFSSILAVSTIMFVSCQKDNSPGTSTTALTSSSNVIAVSTVISSNSATQKTAASSDDSVYVLHTCARGYHRDSITAAALPATVTNYLSTNYAGYTLQQAYSVVNSSNTTAGYVVIIGYNSNPVGLEFDASGNFLRVLEQREGRDLHGNGWHAGGRFDNRDGRHRDTIALSSLPSSVTSYFSTNYSSDTLVGAFRGKDSVIVVLSKNNGAFATVFSSSGTFIGRTALQNKRDKVAVIDQSALPATVLSYLNTTYPGYVFEKAFVIKPGGSVLGYVVVIDANGTRYAVQFNAAGALVKAFTIR